MALSTKTQDQNSESTRSERENGGDKGQSSGGHPARSAHVITEHIDVAVPHDVAYDQWTQFDKWSEMFKKESAKRKSGGGRNSGASGRDTKVDVTAKIGPSQRQWQTETVQREPGRRIAWKAKGGVQAHGITTFHELDDRLTHLMIDIEYRPKGFFETIGNFFRMPRRRVRKDLKLFKNYVELRGKSTGRGPGRVRGPGLKGDMDQESGHDQQEQQEEED